MKKLACLLTVTLLLSGCTTVSKEVLRFQPSSDARQLTQSLFPEDQIYMSNAEIAEVLDGKVIIPQDARIAIVPLGQENRWYWYSDRLAAMDRAAVKDFATQLQQADYVHDALVVPSLLMPSVPTVPRLRHVAARCQADMIFVYTVTYENHRRPRFMAADKWKGACNVEGALFDTRTGVVVLAATSTKEYDAKKSRKDNDVLRQCQIESMTTALTEIGNELVASLNTM